MSKPVRTVVKLTNEQKREIYFYKKRYNAASYPSIAKYFTEKLGVGIISQQRIWTICKEDSYAEITEQYLKRARKRGNAIRMFENELYQRTNEKFQTTPLNSAWV